jgi:histidine triad (HIT) family protein
MSSDSDCVFCKIVAGDIPALTVLDTPDALAFLDVSPLAPGHVLLVPKSHAATLADMTAKQAADIAQHLPRLTQVILDATGANGINILQNNGREAGQVVEHVHFHLIPRCEGDGLGYRWSAQSYAEGAAEKMRQAIRDHF